jgi:hypothetical protein
MQADLHPVQVSMSWDQRIDLTVELLAEVLRTDLSLFSRGLTDPTNEDSQADRSAILRVIYYLAKAEKADEVLRRIVGEDR